MSERKLRSPLGVSLAVGLAALALWDAALSPELGRPPAGVDPASFGQSQEFRWSGAMSPGTTLEIKGINGKITAEGVSGGQAEVVAVKKGKDDDPADVTIEVVEHDGGVTICAIYPRAAGKKPFECAPGKGGEIGSGENDVSVMFTARVPRGVNLTAKTVNGEVEARSIDGDVRASTVNGGVHVSAAGSAAAQTVNGSVTASLGRTEGPLSFQTVNGSITVELPDDVAADVRAQTVHGEIDTDFPITVKGRYGMHDATGTIGGGGPRLSLQTVNGSIYLKRSRG